MELFAIKKLLVERFPFRCYEIEWKGKQYSNYCMYKIDSCGNNLVVVYYAKNINELLNIFVQYSISYTLKQGMKKEIGSANEVSEGEEEKEGGRENTQ